MNLQNIDTYYQSLYIHNIPDQNDKIKSKKAFGSLIYFLNQLDWKKFNDGGAVTFFTFGSFKNGFGTKSSDIDFSIMTNSYINEEAALSYIYQQLDSINQEKYIIKELVLRARIKVLKLYDTTHKLDIDVCINNLLGAVNSKLLKAYSKLDEKVAQGGILLKLWGKKVKIITQNLFSSYAIVIMWFHFLQKQYKMPDLQDQKYNTKGIDGKIQIKRKLEDQCSDFTANLFFVRKGELYDELRRNFQKTISNISLHELLLHFFEYYSTNGDGFKQKYKISIHLQELKQEVDKYSMKDPFDDQHDPIKRIRNHFKSKEKQECFDQAYQKLQNPELIKELFE